MESGGKGDEAGDDSDSSCAMDEAKDGGGVAPSRSGGKAKVRGSGVLGVWMEAASVWWCVRSRGARLNPCPSAARALTPLHPPVPA